MKSLGENSDRDQSATNWGAFQWQPAQQSGYGKAHPGEGTHSSGNTSHENPAKVPLGGDLHAASLPDINTPPTENTPLPSLRDIMASKGIESSYDRDGRKAAQRRLALFKGQSTTPIPGFTSRVVPVESRLRAYPSSERQQLPASNWPADESDRLPICRPTEG